MPPRIHRITGLKLFLLPVSTRVPLKFGPETLTSVTCARVWLRVVDEQGRAAAGWGETPLSVQWVWPSAVSYRQRHAALVDFCKALAPAWIACPFQGHPLEIGHAFCRDPLPNLLCDFNACLARQSNDAPAEPVPYLAALVCCSAFDIALHDAYGNLAGQPVFNTYGPAFLQKDLSHFLEPAADAHVSFEHRWPADCLATQPAKQLRAWHLVGGLDLLEPSDLAGTEPQDGYPVVLTDWIHRDGLKCLKIKLRGTDQAWDLERLVRVGKIALATGIEALSADFNCTVQNPDYVCEVLDQLRADYRQIHDLILYVEQPFPYDLERHRIDVRSVAARKPLFLDESAHDWRMVRLGRDLGWTGVALKTCKTQTGAVLSACWARAHGLSLMVQDLTNPMLAQIPHVLLAAHVGTIMGVETNAMQFYPAASEPEARVHPGLYQRRGGNLDLSTLRGPGFGYRIDEISRQLPACALEI